MLLSATFVLHTLGILVFLLP